MYQSLGFGEVRRTMVKADLNVPDTGSGASGLHLAAAANAGIMTASLNIGIGPLGANPLQAISVSVPASSNPQVPAFVRTASFGSSNPAADRPAIALASTVPLRGILGRMATDTPATWGLSGLEELPAGLLERLFPDPPSETPARLPRTDEFEDLSDSVATVALPSGPAEVTSETVTAAVFGEADALAGQAFATAVGERIGLAGLAAALVGAYGLLPAGEAEGKQGEQWRRLRTLPGARR
jgi:hypothetical protein